MKLLYSVFYLVIFWRLSEAILSIKVLRINMEYTKRFRELARARIDDPLLTFNLRQQQILCNVVSEAADFIRQLITEQNTFSASTPTILKDLPRILSTSGIQKSYFSNVPVYLGPYMAYLNVVPCITSEAGWGLTFGLVSKFMYKVERSSKWKQNVLELTKVIEPSAILSLWNEHELSEYFWNQIVTDKKWAGNNTVPSSMQKLCDMFTNVRVRICSSAFDALSKGDYFEDQLKQINYVMVTARCQRRVLHIPQYGRILRALVLPCFINTDLNSPQFHLLMDSQEAGAVFVLISNKRNKELRLEVRLRKIGALTNPVRD